MKKIKCYDKKGNSINHLIQWDKNQIVYIDDLENGIIPEAHFAVSTHPDEARIYLDAVSEETLNGTKMIKIILPNEILLESATLFIFLYYIEETADSASETTEYFVELPIKSKPCPSDQIYEDNLIFLSLSVVNKNLEQLKSRVDIDETILNGHVANTDNPHSVTCEQIAALPTHLKGNPYGLAELDENGLVPSNQLPSYVDDVIEAYFSDGTMHTGESKEYEITPESSKIYVDLSTGKIYRWSGSVYVEISESLALGETSSTAYRGDRGKIAYDHSQSTHVQTASDIGLGNVDNTSDLDKPISTATQEVINDVISSVETVDNKVDDVDKKVDNILLDNAEALKDALRDIFYPIGTIYESVNPTNPSEFIGGTWESWGAGRVSVGVDEDDEDFNSAEMTGGEKDHILTIEEIPSHTHSVGYSIDDYVKTIFSEDVVFTVDNSVYEINRQSDPPTNVGNGEAHNNLQPYITSYKWKRIA